MFHVDFIQAYEFYAKLNHDSLNQIYEKKNKKGIFVEIVERTELPFLYQSRTRFHFLSGSSQVLAMALR